MSKGRRGNNYPSWYGRNAARNAERRYLRTQRTKAEILTEKRQKIGDILSKYIQLSLVKYFKATQDEINKTGAEMDTLTRWYKSMADVNGEKYAAERLKEKCDGFLPDNFWMPSNIALTVDEMAAAREAGALTCRLWCAAINKILGYGKNKLTKVLRGANAIYKADDLTTAGEEKQAEV